MSLIKSLKDQKRADASTDPPGDAEKLLLDLIDFNAYVGDVYSLGYNDALVQIHDHHRQQVGGIPAQSFLLATRIVEGERFDVTTEDSSIVLLRVLDHADLPNAQEALRVRVETAQRVSGERTKNWDHRDVMDSATNHLLSYAGVRCRVLGTYHVDEIEGKGWCLAFGSDLSNYYPNKGLKVFKPRAETLGKIVNYRDPRRQSPHGQTEVVVGRVRYASTNRRFQQVDSVNVSIAPTDLLSQKTALFGMTRTGKSNTTKIVLRSIFALRWSASPPLRIGQIVFDPDGEYANENAQDASHNQNPNAIKNVWAIGPESDQARLKEDVVTYGIIPHPNDPDRRLMLLNFYVEENLQIGKQIVDAALAGDSTKFIANFRDVVFNPPSDESGSGAVRFYRRVLCYRALLFKAGLQPPRGMAPSLVHGRTPLFSKEFLSALEQSGGKDPTQYASCAAILSKPSPTWAELVHAFFILRNYISDGSSAYGKFDQDYVKKSTSGSWADDDLKKILEMFFSPERLETSRTDC